MKGFLSSREDTFRPPYGRRVQTKPRHCIIVGTTNDDEFLADVTGDRRFWVIVVNTDKIDLVKTAAWRDQLWAEALAAYKTGEHWWLDDDEDEVRAEVNAAHHESDPWEDIILDWITLQTVPPEPKQGAHTAEPIDTRVLTATKVLTDILGVPKAQQDKGAQRRVGAILRGIGYERGYRGRQRVWKRVG